MKDTDETVEVEDENQFGGEDDAGSSPDLPTRPVPPPALPAAKVISSAAVVDADAQDPPAAPARGQILSVDSQLGGDSSAAGQARPPISGGGSVKEFIFKLLGSIKSYSTAYPYSSIIEFLRPFIEYINSSCASFGRLVEIPFG